MRGDAAASPCLLKGDAGDGEEWDNDRGDEKTQSPL